MVISKRVAELISWACVIEHLVRSSREVFIAFQLLRHILLEVCAFNLSPACCVGTLVSFVSKDVVVKQKLIVGNGGLHKNRCHHTQPTPRKIQPGAQNISRFLSEMRAHRRTYCFCKVPITLNSEHHMWRLDATNRVFLNRPDWSMSC